MSYRWLAAAVVAAGAAAAVAYVVLRGPATPAFTAHDAVVVADFINTTGDAVFDDGLRQAVAVLLQQTPFITLLPDPRVQRTLIGMQRPAGEALRGEVARELCQRAGGSATIDGSIAMSGSSYDIAIGARNCKTGTIIAETKGRAATRADVLQTLGTAVVELRRRLGEPAASAQKYNVLPTDAMTASLEALRSYGLGNRARVTQGDEASLPLFQQAVDRDPTFALAYSKRGVVSANIGRVDDSRADALKAFDLRAKVTEYERLYITWNHATRVLQDPKIAYETLKRLSETYPRDFAARNNLGVYHLGRGQYEDALTEYQSAIEIAPDEPLPIANAAYALLFLGRLDEASTMVDRALALRPSGGLAITRWVTALLANHPRAGEFEAVARQMAPPRQMVGAEASLALWRGQLKEYERLQDQLRAQARTAKDDEWLAGIDGEVLIARAVYQRGPFLGPLQQSLARTDHPALVAQSAAVLAALGLVDPVRGVLPRLEQAAKNDDQVRAPTVISRAFVRAADGQGREAVTDLQAALNEFPRALDLHYYIGRIREQLGDLKGAEASYRSVLHALPVLGLNASVSAARLALGEVLLKAGDQANAKEQFDALLTQWKDADTEFALLKMAKADRAQIK